MSEKFTASHLTIKDSAGRLESFNNVSIEMTYILGDKFYKITHNGEETLYNPRNIVFIQMK